MMRSVLVLFGLCWALAGCGGDPGGGRPAASTNARAERAMIAGAVAKWKAQHPHGTCTIMYPDRAKCETATGLPTDLAVIVQKDTSRVSTTRP